VLWVIFLFKNAIQLFILQILIGIGTAILTPAWDAIFSKYEDHGREAFEWSLFEGGRSVVLGMTAIIGGVIVALFGWTVVFVIMFIFEVVGAINSFRLSFTKKKGRQTHFLKRFF